VKKAKKWPYVALVVVALGVSAVLDRLKPATNNNPQQFSAVIIAILAVTIIVPYLAAWALGVMSWFSFNQLVKSGRSAQWPYADGFRFIANGVGLLVLDLIGSPLLSSARDIFLHHHIVAMYLTIATNLFHVLVPLLAFVFMYKGTKHLLSHSNNYGAGFSDKLLPVLMPTIIFVMFFSLLVFRSPMRQISFNPNQLPSYYLPDFLILLLVVVPLAVTWALSLRVILNTERFVHSLPHDLRPSVVRFFYGLSAVISSSIIVQALTALGTQQLQEIGLALALVVLYLFIGLQAVAYGFIYRSAQGLRKLTRRSAHETN